MSARQPMLPFLCCDHQIFRQGQTALFSTKYAAWTQCDVPVHPLWRQVQAGNAPLRSGLLRRYARPIINSISMSNVNKLSGR